MQCISKYFPISRTAQLFWATLLLAVLSTSLSGCSTWLPMSGPSARQVAAEKPPHIAVIDVNYAVARRILAAQQHSLFSDALPGKTVPGYVVGPGDLLEVSIWEAPPAVLFGSAPMDPRAGAATTHVTTFPDQMVAVDGTINVPFAGAVPVAGRSPQQIGKEIAKWLAGKANQPQVLVRVTGNATSNVTVVGEVRQSLRMPLTAKGERLLDALAAAGGVVQPVGKMTIQISRGGRVQSMPLDAVIKDPKQNILLRPGDVVTALFQSNSFTALGAVGKIEEVDFEARGISLAQAMGRIGGVQDALADVSGMFIFRFEDPAALPDDGKGLPRTPEGKVPVVYRANMKDPRTFLAAQTFPIRNQDVVYVANASGAELQKFLNMLFTSLYSVSILKTM